MCLCGSLKGLKGVMSPKDHGINMIKGSFFKAHTTDYNPLTYIMHMYI